MKVLWLGAGASVSAGYPSANGLLVAMDAHVRTGVDVMTSEAWARFAEYRRDAQGVEGTILNSQNPEVALTWPDLLEAALDADNESIEAETIRIGKSISSAGYDEEELKAAAGQIQSRYDAETRKPLELARARRRDFIAVLDAFLAARHYYDAQPPNANARDCLRRELADLESGDVVITTNWDSATERTLFEQGRWTPFDGYGFEVDLVDGIRSKWGGRRVELPEWVPRKSEILVLKLHGSIGWQVRDIYGPRVTEPGQLVLDSSQFLQSLPFARGEELVWARDAREPEFYDGASQPYYMVPSYLKQLGGLTTQAVWSRAASALAGATDLRVVGASLPDADVAIRALLNGTRFRADAGTIRVLVNNPDKRALGRWRGFLGATVIAATVKTGGCA